MRSKPLHFRWGQALIFRYTTLLGEEKNLKHIKSLIRLILLPFLLIGISSPVAFATTNEIAPANKIGVLDWEVILTESPQAKEAKNRLDKEFQVRKDKLYNTQKEYQAKAEKSQRDRDILSEAEKVKLEKEINKMQQELRHMDEEFRADYTASHREEMDKFVKIVREVVEKVAQEEKFDVVIPQEATLFMSNRIDVTEKVLERLNKTKSGSKSDKDGKK